MAKKKEPKNTPLPKPWEQQENESAPAFVAFKVWRDLPPEQRSSPRVASELSKSRQLVNRWRKEHDWDYRSREYDRMLDREATDAEIREHREMKRRHVRISQGIQERAVKRLSAMDPDELTATQVLAYLEAGIRLERLSRDEPSVILERRERYESEEELREKMSPYMRLVEELEAEGAFNEPTTDANGRQSSGE